MLFTLFIFYHSSWSSFFLIKPSPTQVFLSILIVVFVVNREFSRNFRNKYTYSITICVSCTHLGNKLRYSFITLSFIANTYYSIIFKIFKCFLLHFSAYNISVIKFIYSYGINIRNQIQKTKVCLPYSLFLCQLFF